ncbi:MAG: shikimate kinase [Blastocatellia bacterium]|nr:shikimate kinase [Blastocatellia bacterium]
MKTVERPIFLVGFMGSGKTTVGKVLAKKLQAQLIDLDQLIVEKATRSIPEIFQEFGEDYFRKLESETLFTLSFNAPKIVALGGGTFVAEQNREFIKKKGFSIWLNCDFDELVGRLKQDNSRPLYRADNLEQFHKLYLSRLSSYSQADLQIDVTKKRPNQVARQIMEVILKTSGLQKFYS